MVLMSLRRGMARRVAKPGGVGNTRGGALECGGTAQNFPGPARAPRLAAMRVAAPCLILAVLVPLLAHAGGPANVTTQDYPMGAEHRALRTQVTLLRGELKNHSGWNERERSDKLKAELLGLERALNRVEEIYAEKLANCQAFFRDAPKDKETGTADPGYFTCLQTPPVDDALVRTIRRKEEVERRLKDKGMPVATRTALTRELRELESRVDRESGLQPLYMDQSTRVTALDAGADGVTVKGR